MAAEFIKRHIRGGRDIVAEGEAIDGDFHGMVKQREDVVFESEAFVANHQDRLALEAEVVDADRAGGLFKPDESIPFGLKCFKNGGQSAMSLQFDDLSAIASDFRVELRSTARDNSLDAAAASRANNPRQVDVTAERRAGDDEFARPLERGRRPMSHMFEPRHYPLGLKQDETLVREHSEIIGGGWG